jgi:hypothetical protein
LFLLSAGVGSALASDEAEPVRPPECEAEVEPIAIVYHVENPARSMALVGDNGSNLVRVGSWLGERQVLEIGPRSLVLGPVEDPCLMRLSDRSPERKVPKRRRRRRRSRRR